MSNYTRADQNLIDTGKSICYFSAKANIVEAWVIKVANLSGQKVDWGYSCGIANVFFIGDHNKVYNAVLKLKPELDKACIEDSLNDFNIKINGTQGWRLFPPVD